MRERTELGAREAGSQGSPACRWGRPEALGELRRWPPWSLLSCACKHVHVCMDTLAVYRHMHTLAHIHTGTQAHTHAHTPGIHMCGPSCNSTSGLQPSHLFSQI